MVLVFDCAIKRVFIYLFIYNIHSRDIKVNQKYIKSLRKAQKNMWIRNTKHLEDMNSNFVYIKKIYI